MRTEILAADRGFLCRAFDAAGNLYAEIWGECPLWLEAKMGRFLETMQARK
jgi:hypothetical protein